MKKMKGNNMKFLGVLFVVALFSFLVTGCGEKEIQVAEPESAPPVEEVYVAPEPEAPMEMVEEVTNEVLEGRTNAPMMPVYFDFDQSSIRKDQVQRLDMNAAFLKSNYNVSIRIEGNCDERGTNEYNMALGERRAMSAKKYLMNLGVSASQLDTISFGEEKPLNFGQNALAWSQNRRDDFVIMNK
jgi:peptidoglycan-associated lipoprotein